MHCLIKKLKGQSIGPVLKKDSSVFRSTLGQLPSISSKTKNLIPMYIYFDQFLVIKNYHRNKLFKNLIQHKLFS